FKKTAISSMNNILDFCLKNASGNPEKRKESLQPIQLSDFCAENRGKRKEISQNAPFIWESSDLEPPAQPQEKRRRIEPSTTTTQAHTYTLPDPTMTQRPSP